MAIITYIPLDDRTARVIDFDGPAWAWIPANIEQGTNIAVYEGQICAENEISRNEDRMRSAGDVVVQELPGIAGAFLYYALAAVVAGAIVASLIPDVDVSTIGDDSSANNELSDRRNKKRVGGRIVDLVGESLMVPDVIQDEYSFYNDDKFEVRIGAYVFGRNNIDVADLSNGEDLISEQRGAAAGIYRPYTSPNNSEPYEQIGEPINRPIVGVYTSTANAITKTLEAPELVETDIKNGTVTTDAGNSTARISSENIDPENYDVGAEVDLTEVRIGIEDDWQDISAENYIVAEVGEGYLVINTLGRLAGLEDKTWDILTWFKESDAPNAPSFKLNPKIEAPNFFIGDTYKINRRKVNTLLFNVYAPTGIYKTKGGTKFNNSVIFTVCYYLLDDDGNRVGSLNKIKKTLEGATDNAIGATVEVNLGAASYVEWYAYRESLEDEDYNGTVIDTIKLKSVFGLIELDKEHFGNVTMVQTMRQQLDQVSSVSSPQVNAFCTELVYKYHGNGVFYTELTKNTQAMQSLIRLALDDKVGRLTVDDLDADQLIESQADNETYYDTDLAGKCSYSFDDSGISAQDTFYIIANCASILLWREGRVLKSWFERPQSVPEMIFTHRSKTQDSETWNRQMKLEKDGVEMTYIDPDTDSEETIIYPEDAVNTKTITSTGFRGYEQAFWRVRREYHKLMNQRISVDFTAAAEGRFAKLGRLIGVVKGTRVGQAGGEILNVDLLTVELSQEVTFTDGDDHFLVLKTRNGGTQTVSVTATDHPRIVVMDYAPAEEIYTGVDARRTEFSFGNEARLKAQLMMPQTIDGSNGLTTAITAINYSDLYYQDDPSQPVLGSYSDDYSNDYA